jgi:large subunit ribosomal protein L13
VPTYFQKSRRGRIRWQLIDAEGWPLGRLAARASRLLMGKCSPDYTPHADHRDGLIIINSEKVLLTGRKLDQKVYRRHTGYPGGLKEISARELMATRPHEAVREAIRGMLPKTRLGHQLARHLRVYAGPVHPHGVQKPVPTNLKR